MPKEVVKKMHDSLHMVQNIVFTLTYVLKKVNVIPCTAIKHGLQACIFVSIGWRQSNMVKWITPIRWDTATTMYTAAIRYGREGHEKIHRWRSWTRTHELSLRANDISTKHRCPNLSKIDSGTTLQGLAIECTVFNIQNGPFHKARIFT